MLVAWPTIAVSLGVTLVYLFGWVISNNWRLVAGVCLICPVATTVLVYFFLKESPTWLVDKGRFSEAVDSLKWIRNMSYGETMSQEVRDEYETIVESVKLQNKADENTVVLEKSTDSQVKELMLLLCRPDAWKPLAIMNCYFFFMQFAGVNVMMSYTVNIILDVGIELDPYLATFIFGALLFFFGAAATLLLNRLVSKHLPLLDIYMCVCVCVCVCVILTSRIAI